jgi:hypothetical protein
MLAVWGPERGTAGRAARKQPGMLVPEHNRRELE